MNWISSIFKNKIDNPFNFFIIISKERLDLFQSLNQNLNEMAKKKKKLCLEMHKYFQSKFLIYRICNRRMSLLVEQKSEITIPYEFRAWSMLVLPPPKKKGIKIVVLNTQIMQVLWYFPNKNGLKYSLSHLLLGLISYTFSCPSSIHQCLIKDRWCSMIIIISLKWPSNFYVRIKTDVLNIRKLVTGVN